MTEERFLVEASKPASPIVIPTGEVDQMFPGLSKKELIAAMALQGLLANPQPRGVPQSYAKDAVAYAEALLWELGGVQ